MGIINITLRIDDCTDNFFQNVKSVIEDFVNQRNQQDPSHIITFEGNFNEFWE